MTLLQYGVIKLKHYTSHAHKLSKIFQKVTTLLEEYKPDEMALEAPFYGKNVQAMLKLGRAQGVAMAAALAREIPITEYSAKKIKQAVTGNGGASKEQVAGMLQKLLKFKETPELLDATDALSVAVCHFFQAGREQAKHKSWSSFLSENPKRLIKK